MIKALWIAAFLTVSISAQAFPLIRPGQAIPIVPSTFTTNYDFEAIVGLSNCSGGLFRYETSQDSDYALVLTNGHCLESGFIDPGVAVYNIRSARRFKLFNSSGQKVGNLNAEKLVYATMTKTDMAIYKLKETYAEIKTNFQVEPLVLSSGHPLVNDPVEIISGYWKRGYRCAIETFVTKLQESDWYSEDSIRFSRPGCETIGGTSGSPVVLAGSRTIVAVNNTGNDNGGRCTENNPCEIDENGNVYYEEGLSYAQQTYWVYSCLNAQREFDILMPGCVLPR
jgi:V8-like Glu-specific endopeptidase